MLTAVVMVVMTVVMRFIVGGELMMLLAVGQSWGWC